jgi:hypothetical protein
MTIQFVPSGMHSASSLAIFLSDSRTAPAAASRARRADLPQRLFKQHGGYRYANRIDGKIDWIAMGRDV